ncbi:DUF3305 domain-containing protein [Polynucleobacter sp. 30F-ANTBAC]|uniref:DUF3305 domain-containing protein n=1 Tax=Polynucleobacter sp. 30F-ANTBAC TaxID=2689095 RepID=UPI001C0CF995|nr:DUF3305 domain-containing protein [Polynucleobacter sp. 30F-ANTBAC]MBU3599526.1 DUF3305 domain-containing protein [Polynucleobacter sp. 30F-ANTBAC]
MKLQLAVVMRKEFIDNPWQSFRWILDEVVFDIGQFAHKQADLQIAGRPAVCMRKDELAEKWLYTGFELQLFPDEAEGYYLNATATYPAWFVMWRLEDHPDGGEALAVPHFLSVSYYEAGRLLDGGETVENVPLDSETSAWLSAYVAENYKPEPKKRARPASFKGAHRPKTDGA